MVPHMLPSNGRLRAADRLREKLLHRLDLQLRLEMHRAMFFMARTPSALNHRCRLVVQGGGDAAFIFQLLPLRYPMTFLATLLLALIPPVVFCTHWMACEALFIGGGVTWTFGVAVKFLVVQA